jgi:hypothetical protein
VGRVCGVKRGDAVSVGDRSGKHLEEILLLVDGSNTSAS